MRQQACLRVVVWLGVLLNGAIALGAGPQTTQPRSAGTLDQKELTAAFLEKMTELSVQRSKKTPSRESNDVIADSVGHAIPETKQIQAPSAAKPGTTLVDAATFPALLSAAFDNDLLKLQESAFTIDLNLFAFVALANPAVLDRQSVYGQAKYQLLRRFAGSLTLGGKGDSFDRDGDGKPDAAQVADSLGDIVTWEVKARVLGSRDRRDQVNLSRYISKWVLDKEGKKRASLSMLADEVNKGIADFVANHFGELKIDAQGNANAEAVKQLLAQPQTADTLGALAMTWELLNTAAEEALKDIDGSAVWTVVAGGTRQRDQFGPDKWHVGLRGAFSTGRFDHAINLDWLTVDGLRGAPKGKTWKGGFQVSTLLLKGSQLTEDGVALSFSVSAEHASDVPDAIHDNIARAGVKLDFPLSKSVKVPLSINYANHRDVLTDQNEVVGNIGLAVDFSALRKKAS